jgi:hypothetical protein
VRLNVVPHLIVRAEAAGAADPCGVAGAAAGVTRFSVDVSGVTAPATGWQWSVDGASAAALSDPVLEVQMPAQAGVKVTVSVVVTFEDGCSSTGSMTLTTIGAEQAELIAFLCQLAHTAVFGKVFVPSRIIPDPVPDVAFTRPDLVAVGELGERLVQTVNRILQADGATGGLAGQGGADEGAAGSCRRHAGAVAGSADGLAPGGLHAGGPLHRHRHPVGRWERAGGRG